MRLGLLAAGVALVAGWALSGSGARPAFARTRATPATAVPRRPVDARPNGRPRAPASNEIVLEHGRAVRIDNPYLGAGDELVAPAGPAPAPAHAPVARLADAGRAHAASAAGPSVSAALATLEQSAAITPQQHAAYLSDYEAAKHSLTKLTGTRATELGDVIANLQEIAANGGFIASRLPALFLTLVDNRLWWTTGPLLSDDQHVGFSGSHIVWEYYPGQGIEIQWLATFGEANAYYTSGTGNTELAALLTQIIPLATQRAGGIAWEYMFDFDGGAPPWTSALSQGTAIQSLARAWSRLHTQAYLTAAQQALGIFQTPPPTGVRVSTSSGAWYVQYTFAPGDLILNGFVQSLVGLFDYTSLTGDPLGEQLFVAGDAEARAQVPSYNTGAWSLYDQYGESDLSYHDLLTQFLGNLCQRTQQTINPLSLAPRDALSTAGKAASTAAHTAAAPANGATGATGTTAAGSQTPSTGAVVAPVGTGVGGAVTGPTGVTTSPTDPDAIYCQTAADFTADLKTKPVLKLLSTTLQGGKTLPLQFTLSKISTVSVTVAFQGHTLLQNGGLMGHGTHYFDWAVPTKAGSYSVALAATDLAGNDASVSGSVTVLAPPKPKPKPKPPGEPGKPGTTTTTTTSATSTTSTTARTTTSTTARTSASSSSSTSTGTTSSTTRTASTTGAASSKTSTTTAATTTRPTTTSTHS